MKGRGTRTYTFKYEKEEAKKETFKIFDFFAVCEYFEHDFNYDEKIAVPKNSGRGQTTDPTDIVVVDTFISEQEDDLVSYTEEVVGAEGMKIDRKFYQSFEDKVHNDTSAQQMIQAGDGDQLEHYLRTEILDKPVEFYTIKKLEQALGLDRRLTIKEVVQYLLGNIHRFKGRQEMIDDEFDNFKLLNQSDLMQYSAEIASIEVLFDAFITDPLIRKAVREKRLQVLINSPLAQDLRATKDVRIKGKRILDYMSDYVAVNDINCERYSA